MKRLIIAAAILVASVVMTASVHAQEGESRLRISELISEIRKELIKAEEDAAEQNLTPLFYTAGMEIEISFLVEETEKGSGIFDLFVVTFGGEVEYSEINTQKIRLHFKTPIPSVTPMKYHRWAEFMATTPFNGGRFFVHPDIGGDEYTPEVLPNIYRHDRDISDQRDITTIVPRQ